MDLDSVTYIATTGAQAQAHQQATIAQNLSNANSTGYCAQLAMFQQIASPNQEGASLVHIVRTATRFENGPLEQTQQPLDVALPANNLFFVVVDAAGASGLTRDGHFHLNQDGQMQNKSGQLVLGDGGPIAIPANSHVTIDSRGTISALSGDSKKAPQVIAKIRVVEAPLANLDRDGGGLFHLPNNQIPADTEKAIVQQGYLNASNVNIPEQLQMMIENSRTFEYNLKIIHELNENRRAANQLLAIHHS